ncbi:hypothetical protein NP233_g8173 [Leucocoprinus birnbaumii]|uniref:NACHT domain-containing protein n=1 Tax=Leucocoprinus birnbaumii TaxID=56174 RepID=A0AAD5YTZ5_9AGAR|nr:hypothetical protein NP233_g8173 [Leucocoprinus birnbaumii]
MQQFPDNSTGKRSFIRRIFSSKRPPPPSLLPAPNRPVTASDAITSKGNQAPSLPTPEDNAQVNSNVSEDQDAVVPNGVVRVPISSRPCDAPLSSGILQGSHDFMIERPTFIQHNNNVTYKVEKPFSDSNFLEKFFVNIDNGGTVLLILDKKRVTGAEMDSSDRDPPPRCHPETRKELRDTLNTWLVNDRRPWNFIWLSGPAGAGKSAVTQTFAEHCHKLGYLGASFFFSRSKRDTANGFIATITYQLAEQDAGYNHIVTSVLARNPAILDKALHVQFQKLLEEPFATLAQGSSPGSRHKPIVIVVDGLDECSDENAQCQIIRLIGTYVRKSASSTASTLSVLWFLSSRPEWHIKRTFAQADPPFQCGRELITCDAEQDAKDVYLILRDGLQKIRDQSSWSLSQIRSSPQWPSEAKLQRLARQVGGLPVLASTVLRFIGDGTGAPDSQLDTCLLFLETTGDMIQANPLDALDALYRQIMTRVPQQILPITQFILSFYTLLPTFSTFVYNRGMCRLERLSEVACFLNMEKDNFYSALQCLHSVIEVPPSESAHEASLRFFHKSFPDFLEDPLRSGPFSLNLDQARYKFAILSIRFNDHFLRNNCKLKDCSCEDDFSISSFPWISDQARGELQLSQDRLKLFARVNCWRLCRSVRKAEMPSIVTELSKFSFCHLFSSFSSKDDDDDFWSLVQWLWDGQDDRKDSLIRFAPSSLSDQSMISRSRATALQIIDHLELDEVQGNLIPRFFSFHQTSRASPPLLDYAKIKFWIGIRGKTALVYGLPDEDKYKEELAMRYKAAQARICIKPLCPEFQYQILRNLNTQVFEARYSNGLGSHLSPAAKISSAVKDLTNLIVNDKTLSDFVLMNPSFHGDILDTVLPDSRSLVGNPKAFSSENEKELDNFLRSWTTYLPFQMKRVPPSPRELKVSLLKFIDSRNRKDEGSVVSSESESENSTSGKDSDIFFSMSDSEEDGYDVDSVDGGSDDEDFE